jgi:hypothetical protein
VKWLFAAPNGKWPFAAPNGWVATTCSFGRYYAVHLLPELEITWISLNRSLHFEVRWLVFEAKLNTFWRFRS